MFDMNRMPIVEALEEYVLQNRISMHVPGHKGVIYSEPIVKSLFEEVLKRDVTEIEGMDDFHATEGIIAEAQQLAAQLYGAERTFFLVNGTTSGIMAAVTAVSGDEDSIIAAGNCHSSVTRGMVLSGAKPIYINPYFDDKSCLFTGLQPERLEEIFLHNNSIKAVIVTHPSYYGTYSDLESICRCAHAHGAVVIADEAHGAQLEFCDFAKIPTALSCGADISVQSTHKMLGSMTQSSMLHVQGNLIDIDKLSYFISLLTSTSPSYILMASLDAVRKEMAVNGKEKWDEIYNMTSEAADRISELEGISCLRYFSDNGVLKPIEGSRLILNASGCGMSGGELATELYSKYRIDVEFSDDIYAVALFGVGSLKSDFDALIEALREISTKRRGEKICEIKQISELIEEISAVGYTMEMSPRKAAMSKHEFTQLNYAEGMIAAEAVSVYPPGIPLLQPGEKITAEKIIFIESCLDKNLHMHGIRIRKNGTDLIYGLMTAGAEERDSIFNIMI
ncbi:MAG: aminotransferase class I/II-fold pyridoxal phosphate-dependent enzyme [Anaerovoracaceae bacterium]